MRNLINAWWAINKTVGLFWWRKASGVANNPAVKNISLFYCAILTFAFFTAVGTGFMGFCGMIGGWGITNFCLVVSLCTMSVVALMLIPIKEILGIGYLAVLLAKNIQIDAQLVLLDKAWVGTKSLFSTTGRTLQAAVKTIMAIFPWVDKDELRAAWEKNIQSMPEAEKQAVFAHAQATLEKIATQVKQYMRNIKITLVSYILLMIMFLIIVNVLQLGHQVEGHYLNNKGWIAAIIYLTAILTVGLLKPFPIIPGVKNVMICSVAILLVALGITIANYHLSVGTAASAQTNLLKTEVELNAVETDYKTEKNKDLLRQPEVIAIVDTYALNENGVTMPNLLIKKGSVWKVVDDTFMVEIKMDSKLIGKDRLFCLRQKIVNNLTVVIYGLPEWFEPYRPKEEHRDVPAVPPSKLTGNNQSVSLASSPTTAYFAGQPYPLGQCQVTQTSDGYQITAPAGTCLAAITGIKVTTGQKLTFQVSGQVSGSTNSQDGACQWVGAHGWNYQPTFLNGRPLICPQANFMEAVGHIVDETGRVLTSFPLRNEVIMPASGFIIIGSNEPLTNCRGQFYNAASDNGGNYAVKMTAQPLVIT